MTEALYAVYALGWSAAYMAATVVGFRHRTYAIPAFAIMFNLAWEITYAVHYLGLGLSFRSTVDGLWVVLDIGVFLTLLLFGHREFRRFRLSPTPFRAVVIGGLAVAFAMQFSVVLAAGGDWSPAARYSGFGQNVVMSALFLAMYARRRGPRGQSLVVGWGKLIGTAAVTIVFGVLEGMPFVLVAGLLAVALDVAYVALLWRGRLGSRATVRTEADRSEAVL